MKLYRHIIILVLAISCISGCNKPAEPETKAESAVAQANVPDAEIKTPEQLEAKAAQAQPEQNTDSEVKPQSTAIAENKTPEQQEAKAAQAQPEQNADGEAKPQPAAVADDPSSKPQQPAEFRVDFSSKEFPEIHTHDSVTSEAAWGQIKRTTLEWCSDIEIYHEIPVFNDNSPAFAAINAEMQKIHQEFFTKANLEDAWEFEYERHKDLEPGKTDDEKYTDTNQAKVTEYSGKYVSITFDLEWYMGGVADYGTSAYVFDRSTGKSLKLTDIYKKDAKAIRAMVTKAVKADVSKNGDPDLMEWGALAEMEDFNFYMENGVPHVVFKKYEIAVGAAGAFDVKLPKP